MARSMIRYLVTVRGSAAELVLIEGAAVTVALPAGTAVPVFAAESGGSALSQPVLSNVQGEIVLWVDEAVDTVDLSVTDNGGGARRAGIPGRTVRFAPYVERIRAIPSGAAADVSGVTAALAAEVATRAADDLLRILLTEKGAANGVATLDGGSKVPAAQIPALALSEFLGTVASQAAMLALVGQRGDWAVRTDPPNVGAYILAADDGSVLANWIRVPAPADAVLSVNSRTGVVTGLAEQTALDAEVTARGAALAALSATLVPKIQQSPAMGTALRILTIDKPANDPKPHAPFTWETGGAQFLDTWDAVQYIGYNIRSGGAKVVPTEPYFCWAIESDYERLVTLDHVMEVYWEARSADGTRNVRPIFTSVDRNTLNTATVFQHYDNTVGSGGITFESYGAGAATGAYLKFTAVALNLLRAYTMVWSYTGAKTMLKALNNAGTNGLQVLYQHTDDGIRIGDGNSFGHTHVRLDTKLNKFLKVVAGATLNNLGLNGESYGGGDGVIYVANAATEPTTNPSGGGIFYIFGGALKYRGSSGTVTTVGPA